MLARTAETQLIGALATNLSCLPFQYLHPTILLVPTLQAKSVTNQHCHRRPVPLRRVTQFQFATGNQKVAIDLHFHSNPESPSLPETASSESQKSLAGRPPGPGPALSDAAAAAGARRDVRRHHDARVPTDSMTWILVRGPDPAAGQAPANRPLIIPESE